MQQARPHTHRRSAAERALFTAWLLALLTVPSSTRAQASRWSARAHGSIALMLSEDQLGRLRYDQPGLLAELAAEYEALPWLAGQLSAKGGGFFSEAATGGLLSPAVGLRVHPARRTATPHAGAALGAAFTGSLVRPRVSLSAGFDVQVGKSWSVGPVLGVDDVVQRNRARDSSDAVFFHFGLSIGYRRPAPEPARPALRTPVPHESARPAPVVSAPSVDIDLLMASTFQQASTRLELLAPVLFALDSDQLEPIGVAMLHEVANTLRERADIALLEIQGYADERGNQAHNEQLSRRRAERVREWLLTRGVASGRLRIAAHGSAAPLETTGDEAAHQQNRRVVFRVIETSPEAAP